MNLFIEHYFLFHISYIFLLKKYFFYNTIHFVHYVIIFYFNLFFHIRDMLVLLYTEY